MFNKDTMPPVSTTMKCIMNLAIQYFVVFTALAILRTINQLYGGVSNAVKLTESACSTVVYAPMMSVLFLGTRMRAIQLSQGQTEKFDLPQDFVKTGMVVATWSVLAQVALVLLMPLVTGEMAVPTDAEGNVDLEKLQSKMNKNAMILLNVLRYGTLASLYGGIVAVVYGVYFMPAPDTIWGEAGPPVSPAVAATVNLTTQFFVIYLGLAISRTLTQFQGTTPALKKLSGSFELAAFTVNMAPMLCVLFIGARMRALQIDPKFGNPQAWAQNCFFLCAYSVLFQAVLCVALPWISSEIVCKKGQFEGDVVFEGLSGHGATLLTTIRYLALLSLYGGFTAVMYSIFVIENKVDASLTPPLSPAMACVMGLTLQYFTVYLALFVANTVRTFTSGAVAKGAARTQKICEAARGTVMFAPMLSVLFIGARMRALQLTKATDGTVPAGAGPMQWMQDNMYFATWAVLIQLVLVIALDLYYGEAELDADGNAKAPKSASPLVGHSLNAVRYLCMAAMYGGSCAVIYGVAVMTPETLPPYAKPAPLVPGLDVAAPPLPPTAAEKF
jgi:hypothetical protein